MNAPLCRWVLMRAGREVHGKETAKHFLGLKAMAGLLPIPDCETLIAQHHNAGADAHITCLIYVTVLQVVYPELCAGPHVISRPPLNQTRV